MPINQHLIGQQSFSNFQAYVCFSLKKMEKADKALVVQNVNTMLRSNFHHFVPESWAFHFFIYVYIRSSTCASRLNKRSILNQSFHSKLSHFLPVPGGPCMIASSLVRASWKAFIWDSSRPNSCIGGQASGLRLWKGLMLSLYSGSATEDRSYTSFALRYSGGFTSLWHSTMYLKAQRFSLLHLQKVFKTEILFVLADTFSFYISCEIKNSKNIIF